MKTLLLCTDLDRTLIPNGAQPESSRARELFSLLVKSGDIKLVYVSGRRRELIEEAIEEYQLPVPDFAITDVGSTIYRINENKWHQWRKWDEHISSDWQGMSRGEIQSLLTDIEPLRLQEAETQKTHKLSYYLSLRHKHEDIIAEIKTRLKNKNILASVIWSVDEVTRMGLLDILPHGANKLKAIEFLMQKEGYEQDNVIFSGDSGNDLDVLLSPIQSILVANADETVRAVIDKASPENLYVAKGNFLEMNGCYSAGIIEGIAHYRPEFIPQIERHLNNGKEHSQ